MGWNKLGRKWKYQQFKTYKQNYMSHHMYSSRYNVKTNVNMNLFNNAFNLNEQNKLTAHTL